MAVVRGRSHRIFLAPTLLRTSNSECPLHTYIFIVRPAPAPAPPAPPLHMAHCSVAACGPAALRSSSVSSINSSSSSSRRVAAASSSSGGGRRRGGGRLVVTAKVDLQGAPRIIRGKCFVTKDVSGAWLLEGRQSCVLRPAFCSCDVRCRSGCGALERRSVQAELLAYV